MENQLPFSSPQNLPPPVSAAYGPGIFPKKKIMLLGGVLAIVFFCAATAYGVYATYIPYSSYRGNKTVMIPSGYGLRMIGALLKQEGAIRSKWVFIIYATLNGAASSLKPGTYSFGRENIPRITADLVRGVNREVSLTIPEGWDIADISSRLGEEGIATGHDFAAFTSHDGARILKEKFPFLADLPAGSSLEGYLFPDTYHFFRDTTQLHIAETLLANFSGKITPEIKEEMRKKNISLHEAVIMASLVEKEVVSDDDRRTVSGILWKRLRLGIPLQVDATINYAKKLAGDERGPNGKIYVIDTKIDSPYNTYRYRGLPPGPIGNPGLSALKAAINPKDSSYLYYLSTPDGRTIFSRTLEEHNAAKAKYLK